jgi:hypothetical protein
MAADIGTAEPGEIILSRDCRIEGPDGDVSPLTLRFTRPVRRAVEGFEKHFEFVGTLHMECKHFTEVQRLSGDDELHVLCMLLWIGRILLENREGDGYSIWWREKGDLHYFDFWMGSQFQQEFCLPSAYVDAKRERFYAANAGKFLMPSHRVGVEPDRRHHSLSGGGRWLRHAQQRDWLGGDEGAYLGEPVATHR